MSANSDDIGYLMGALGALLDALGLRLAVEVKAA